MRELQAYPRGYGEDCCEPRTQLGTIFTGLQIAMRILRIAMAQMNPTVGDIAGNTRAIKRWIKEATE